MDLSASAHAELAKVNAIIAPVPHPRNKLNLSINTALVAKPKAVNPNQCSIQQINEYVQPSEKDTVGSPKMVTGMTLFDDHKSPISSNPNR